MSDLWVIFFFLFSLVGSFTAYGNVVLIGNNITLSFDDIEANFAPSVRGSGICGTLYVAEPLDACSSLTNKIVPVVNNTTSPFVLIVRGGCSFDDKVRSAQAAGFKAAIVYDNENGELVPTLASSSLYHFQLKGFSIMLYESLAVKASPGYSV